MNYKKDEDYIFQALWDYGLADIRNLKYRDLPHKLQKGLCHYFSALGYTEGHLPHSVVEAYEILHDRPRPSFIQLWFAKGDLESRLEILIKAYNIEREKKKEKRKLEYEKELIKQALFHYRLGYYTYFSRYFLDTWLGFCDYFGHNKVPKSLKTVKEKEGIEDLDGWWFRSGKHKPRIKLLKKTLNYINNKLEEL